MIRQCLLSRYRSFLVPVGAESSKKHIEICPYRHQKCIKYVSVGVTDRMSNLSNVQATGSESDFVSERSSAGDASSSSSSCELCN